MNRDKFLNLLFDKEQVTCFAEDPFGVKVGEQPKEQDIFFSINALHPTEDMQPIKHWHAADKPRRADANVVCFRNFLIELDNMELDKQEQYVLDKLPISTQVFSGSKSYHFIISLEQPLRDYSEYMEYAARIHEMLPKIDSACKNPSRLSRLPGAVRPDTGLKQELLYVGERVPNAQLDTLLPAAPIYDRMYTSPESTNPSKLFMPVQIADVIEQPAKKIAYLGGRNQYFFWLGCRLREIAGMSQEHMYKKVSQAYERLPDTRDFTIEEALQAARLR